MTTKHICISLDYVLRAPAQEIEGMFRMKSTGHALSALEARTHAVIMKAKGFVVLPACDHYDAQGMCLGHAKGDPEI